MAFLLPMDIVNNSGVPASIFLRAGCPRGHFPPGAVGEAPPTIAVHAAKAASAAFFLPILKPAAGMMKKER